MILGENRSDFPFIRQAEVYRNGSCTFLRIPYTERIVNATSPRYPAGVRFYGDIDALLDSFDGVVEGAQIVVALGDSTTTNWDKWPRWTSDALAKQSNSFVVNLADWGNEEVEHYPILNHFLTWASTQRAGSMTIINLGGACGVVRRLLAYTDFLSAKVPSPLTEPEIAFGAHPAAASLRRLNARVPEDWPDVRRWIARRYLESVKVLETLCASHNAWFMSVMQPLCYEDLAPGYLLALRGLFEREPRNASFDDWRRVNNYARDISDGHPGPAEELRATFDASIAEFHRYALTTKTGRFIDLSGLFRQIDGSGWDETFDAFHYAPKGSQFIATVLAELVLRGVAVGSGLIVA